MALHSDCRPVWVAASLCGAMVRPDWTVRDVVLIYISNVIIGSHIFKTLKKKNENIFNEKAKTRRMQVMSMK